MTFRGFDQMKSSQITMTKIQVRLLKDIIKLDPLMSSKTTMIKRQVRFVEGII